jgi:nicotinate-nucleotide adenylyltransferase
MKAQEQRIGVYGGTFDPVHLGHLRAARAAYDHLQLDRLIWVPNHHSPLRMHENRTSGTHRLAMVQAAVEGEAGFEVSDIEVTREGPSYLIDTLEELRSHAPEADWHFLMGLDSLDTFDRWVRVNEIVALVRVWVMPRPGEEAEQALADLEARAPKLSGRIQILPGPLVDISASEIRERVQAGEDITDLVPAAVAGYVQTHGLYR